MKRQKLAGDAPASPDLQPLVTSPPLLLSDLLQQVPRLFEVVEANNLKQLVSASTAYRKLVQQHFTKLRVHVRYG